MKGAIISVFAVLVLVFAPGITHASPISNLEQRISTAVATQSAQQIELRFSGTDKYGTPLIIQLARRGDIPVILEARNAASGKFLTAKDTYGNNVFHAAKNADTVQAIASLIRHFYGGQTPQVITTLVDAKNLQGETPLLAQINAGHADTFLPLYTYSTLKKKNDTATRQLARLHGVNEAIAAPNREIYCQEVVALSSAAGRTLLQAAQDQVPYHPEMADVVRTIGQQMPCLAK